jgi:hypothetical protein
LPSQPSLPQLSLNASVHATGEPARQQPPLLSREVAEVAGVTEDPEERLARAITAFLEQCPTHAVAGQARALASLLGTLSAASTSLPSQ